MPNEATQLLAVGFVLSSNSATHHSTQMLLLAALGTEIFAGLKQSRGSCLFTGAAPKQQQTAELRSL